MKLAAVTLAAALTAPLPVLAQSDPVGIGFAQAEEGTWWCQDQSHDKALACALDKCRKASRGQECHATRWCLPAGWSGLMTVWLPEFHNTIVLCGTSGEPALIAALAALCDHSPFVTRCTPFLTIDPKGKDHPIDGLDWPGPAIVEQEKTEPDQEPRPPDLAQ